MVVDSSVWIELLTGGRLQGACERHIHKQTVEIPTMVLFEIYRKIKKSVSEQEALEAIGALSAYRVVDLTRDIALLAADLSLEFKLAMADGFVLAHARHLGTTLLTLDNDFESIPGVNVLR